MTGPVISGTALATGAVTSERIVRIARQKVMTAVLDFMLVITNGPPKEALRSPLAAVNGSASGGPRDYSGRHLQLKNRHAPRVFPPRRGQ